MTYIPQSQPKLTVMHEGRKWHLVDLARATGVPYERMRQRFHEGQRGDKLVRPVQQRDFRLSRNLNGAGL